MGPVVHASSSRSSSTVAGPTGDRSRGRRRRRGSTHRWPQTRLPASILANHSGRMGDGRDSIHTLPCTNGSQSSPTLFGRTRRRSRQPVSHLAVLHLLFLLVLTILCGVDPLSINLSKSFISPPESYVHSLTPATNLYLHVRTNVPSAFLFGDVQEDPNQQQQLGDLIPSPIASLSTTSASSCPSTSDGTTALNSQARPHRNMFLRHFLHFANAQSLVLQLCTKFQQQVTTGITFANSDNVVGYGCSYSGGRIQFHMNSVSISQPPTLSINLSRGTVASSSLIHFSSQANAVWGAVTITVDSLVFLDSAALLFAARLSEGSRLTLTNNTFSPNAPNALMGATIDNAAIVAAIVLYTGTSSTFTLYSNTIITIANNNITLGPQPSTRTTTVYALFGIHGYFGALTFSGTDGCMMNITGNTIKSSGIISNLEFGAIRLYVANGQASIRTWGPALVIHGNAIALGTIADFSSSNGPSLPCMICLLTTKAITFGIPGTAFIITDNTISYTAQSIVTSTHHASGIEIKSAETITISDEATLNISGNTITAAGTDALVPGVVITATTLTVLSRGSVTITDNEVTATATGGSGDGNSRLRSLVLGCSVSVSAASSVTIARNTFDASSVGGQLVYNFHWDTASLTIATASTVAIDDNYLRGRGSTLGRNVFNFFIKVPSVQLTDGSVWSLSRNTMIITADAVRYAYALYLGGVETASMTSQCALRLDGNRVDMQRTATIITSEESSHGIYTPRAITVSGSGTSVSANGNIVTMTSDKFSPYVFIGPNSVVGTMPTGSTATLPASSVTVDNNTFSFQHNIIVAVQTGSLNDPGTYDSKFMLFGSLSRLTSIAIANNSITVTNLKPLNSISVLGVGAKSTFTLANNWVRQLKPEGSSAQPPLFIGELIRVTDLTVYHATAKLDVSGNAVFAAVPNPNQFVFMRAVGSSSFTAAVTLSPPPATPFDMFTLCRNFLFNRFVKAVGDAASIVALVTPGNIQLLSRMGECVGTETASFTRTGTLTMSVSNTQTPTFTISAPTLSATHTSTQPPLSGSPTSLLSVSLSRQGNTYTIPPTRNRTLSAVQTVTYSAPFGPSTSLTLAPTHTRHNAEGTATPNSITSETCTVDMTLTETIPLPPVSTQPPVSLDVAPMAADTLKAAGSLSAAATIVADPVTMMQMDAVASVMALGACTDDGLHDDRNSTEGLFNGGYDVSNNPLHMFVGPSVGSADRGALLTAAIIVPIAVLFVPVITARSLAKRDTYTCTSIMAALPRLFIPSLLLTPLVFAMRLAVRSGVRLAVFASEHEEGSVVGDADSLGGSGVDSAALTSSEVTADTVGGIIAVAISGAYVAYILVTVTMLFPNRIDKSGSSIKAVRSYPYSPSLAALIATLPRWHQWLEHAMGRTSYWAVDDGRSTSSTDKHDKANKQHSDSSAKSTDTHSRDATTMPHDALYEELSIGDPVDALFTDDDVDVDAAAGKSAQLLRAETNGSLEAVEDDTNEPNNLHTVHLWLYRNGNYISKSQHYAWYGVAQVVVTMVLKGLAAAAQRRTCLARNVAALAVVLVYVLTLALLRPIPIASKGKWVTCLATNGILLVCSVINTINAIVEDPLLLQAVVTLSLVALVISAFGTALMIVHIIVNRFHKVFRTKRVKYAGSGEAAGDAESMLGALLLFDGGGGGDMLGEHGAYQPSPIVTERLVVPEQRRFADDDEDGGDEMGVVRRQPYEHSESSDDGRDDGGALFALRLSNFPVSTRDRIGCLPPAERQAVASILSEFSIWEERYRAADADAAWL